MLSRIAEKIIRKGMEEEIFDDLEGRGKPLDLKIDPNTPVEWRMAFKLLKNANLSPPWIELNKEVRVELAEARMDLLRAFNIFGSEGEGWDQAVQDFTVRINQVNEFLRRLNLIVPEGNFQRMELKPEEEIERVLSQPIQPDENEIG